MFSKNIKEVTYKITISNGRNINTIIEWQSDTRLMDSDICSEIAYIMVYKQSKKFVSFDDYKNSEDPKITVNVVINIDNKEKIYIINENLLMYIYNYKYDEFYKECEYVESEYEISDWAISSDTDDFSI